MSPPPDPSRDLLFGLLALQVGLIDQGQLVAAFQAWTRDKARSLADLLASRGDLDAEQRAGVEAMVALHLKKHGDVEKSLAAVPAGKSTRERLAALADPVLEATLSHAGSGPAPGDGDALARAPTRSARPRRMDFASACCGPTRGAAWAPSSSRSTRSCTARSPSSRSSTATPTTR
jgi:hypothetical protein